jgi:hypothetical protein
MFWRFHAYDDYSFMPVIVRSATYTRGLALAVAWAKRRGFYEGHVLLKGWWPV